MTPQVRAVLEEYAETLVAPAQPARTLFILCPVGLVGAGKTTVTKPLAERLSLVRISGDDIRHRLKDRGLSYDSLEEIAQILTKKYLAR